MPEKRLVRLLLQQCTSAQLDLRGTDAVGAESDADLILERCGAPDDDGLLKIGPGLVLFVCFLSGCDDATARRAATTALSARLSESAADSRRTAITSAPGDILVVPQATLGGQLKGKQFQYHGNVSKADGARLYAVFVEALSETAAEVDGWSQAGCRIRCGRYGARQVLSSTTNGPFSHVIEL
ncbi:D-aminoacyl-tRNA deacylase 2-like isoform X2 [Amphibalanus amphitrite]|uniref:D-aminoacyl-tRNA deacylase 2-like isoform X2 n=1 Tax=Amphibalanus amphitrite TaxID=1232801 RepID=UPI001C91029D|nr:D-aminoacyl-tRNA deacylase 2-like isoform X2 [Amphibalanus amphitrite]